MKKKIELAETKKATASAEPATEAPAAKKPTPKPVKPKAGKPGGQKLGPQEKKIAEKPKKAIVAKAKKAPDRKPGKKPRVKAAAKVPVLAKRKSGPKKQKPIARKADLVKRGEEAFLFATRQQEQIEEMERVIANYERMFEAVRQLFSREMHEIEEWVEGLLK